MTTATPPMPETSNDTDLNPCGLQGLAFLEYAGQDSDAYKVIFKKLGLSPVRTYAGASDNTITHWQCQRVNFLLNEKPDGFGAEFAKLHGQTACGMGFEVADPETAYKTAIARGAQPHPGTDLPYPAILGVGGSAVYFVNNYQAQSNGVGHGFEPMENPPKNPEMGFEFIDHLTNNVGKGQKDVWSSFYQGIFGFTLRQYFDINGTKTGLVSDALQSPCKTFCIPINEAKEEKSQIAEYIREYKGEGIQHIALHSSNLLGTLDNLEGSGIETLDIDNEYYDTIYDRVEGVTEDRDHIKRHQVLVDGDEGGYLLQIFTKNIFGPIFYEFIQRKNNDGFGHGNFGALFKSIERDQERRGVL